MRVATYPLRLTQTQQEIEQRRLRTCRRHRRGMSLRQIARAERTSVWTAWHDVIVVTTVWPASRLGGLADSIDVHQQRRRDAPAELWGPAALDRKLGRRLLRVLERRRRALDDPPTVDELLDRPTTHTNRSAPRSASRTKDSRRSGHKSRAQRT